MAAPPQLTSSPHFLSLSHRTHPPARGTVTHKHWTRQAVNCPPRLQVKERPSRLQIPPMHCWFWPGNRLQPERHSRWRPRSGGHSSIHGAGSARRSVILLSFFLSLSIFCSSTCTFFFFPLWPVFKPVALCFIIRVFKRRRSIQSTCSISNCHPQNAYIHTFSSFSILGFSFCQSCAWNKSFFLFLSSFPKCTCTCVWLYQPPPSVLLRTTTTN